MVRRGTAIVRLYGELNDFLPAAYRQRDIVVEMDLPRSVKVAIESLGVPHTGIDLILVDGTSVDFAHRLHGGERVAVYPMFEALDITAVVRLRLLPLRVLSRPGIAEPGPGSAPTS